MPFHIRLKTPAAALLCMLGLMLHFACEEEYVMDSAWKTGEIIIDGKSSDWLGRLAYIEDKAASIGVLNDGDFLYLCMITEGPLLAGRIMGSGLTIWFDPQGKTEKTLGIKYPVGRSPAAFGDRAEKALPPDEDRDGQSERQEETSRPPRKFQPENFIFNPGDEIEILKSGAEQGPRTPLADIEGLELVISAAGGLLTYEMKIPLRKTSGFPLAIGALPEKPLGLGFKTGEIDRKQMRNTMPGRAGMGGRGGFGGPGGGGGMAGEQRGGMRGGAGNFREMNPDLDIWIRINLAKMTSNLQ